MIHPRRCGFVDNLATAWQQLSQLTNSLFIVKAQRWVIACFSTYFVKNTKLLGPLCPWRCFAINQTKQVFFMTEDIEICSMPRVTFAKVLNLFRRLLHHTLWDFYSGEWKVITNLPTAPRLGRVDDDDNHDGKDNRKWKYCTKSSWHEFIWRMKYVESPIFETLQVPRMSWQMSQVENMPFRNIFSFAAQFQTECFELL